MKLFKLVEYVEYEGDNFVGIYSTEDKARAVYDAELAKPYGERRSGELRCYLVELDATVESGNFPKFLF
jgi:hypothetical protein